MSDQEISKLERRWRASNTQADLFAYCEALRRAGRAEAAASLIMGSNMLGTREVEQHFGPLKEEQRRQLAFIPFDWQTLARYANNHILTADTGFSILNVRQKARRGLFYSYDDSWYNAEEFAQETDKAYWRLIRKTPVDDSTIKSWDEQKKLIADTDEIPSARAMVYMIILNFLATGERLFETLYVRTSSVSSRGSRVDVSGLDRDALRIYDGYCGVNDLGVSSAVRPRKS